MHLANFMVVGECSRECIHLRAYKEREQKREGARAKYSNPPFPPTRLHLPQFHHLPKVYSKLESINGLHH
jgi:hypothetical protein